MMSQLTAPVHEAVKELAAHGDQLAEQGAYEPALAEYEKAWALLPEPRLRWEAATWLLAAIGDTHFKANNFAAAALALQDAMHCPGAIGNPFLHLRLGEALFELGEKARALDELARAYMGAGREIFKAEDPKYLAALSTVMRPPPGQTSL